MRRFSYFLALAVVLLSTAIGYTYKLRLAKARRVRQQPAPEIRKGYEAMASSGWRYWKDDPQTNRPMVHVDAKGFEATRDPSTFELHELRLRLFDKDAQSYTLVKSDKALFDERSGLLNGEGPVLIVMHVPVDQDADDPAVAQKHIQVKTTGVTYETKTGKASTEKTANFTFPKGSGRAVGADYDPNTKILHMKSQVALDWVGTGPAENRMHIESSDLVYKEAEQRVYLTPWAKLQRQATTIQCQNAVVTLEDQRVRLVEGEHAFGTDNREDRQTAYSADTMRALFNEDGVLVNIVGERTAKVTSTQAEARTALSGDKADMRFTVTEKLANGVSQQQSDLKIVMADGHAIAESQPLPRPGAELPDTRLLRSEHIELEMKPGGRDLQEIRTSSQAQLEFKPNRPGLPHRIVDASHLRMVYGPGSYADTFLAWNVSTRTDKPALAKGASGKGNAPAEPCPALTWSDELKAKFRPNSNQLATLEQIGNFRYEEGVRKASSKAAYLDQSANRMILVENARVLDDTGSAIADKIVMDQTSGDMDAEGHVVSSHAPNKNQKPGTSVLDNTEPMQAKADKMLTREGDTRIDYEGHAIMWQGANRITADVLDIDRDKQTLHAHGNVISELLDKKTDAQTKTGGQSAQGPLTLKSGVSGDARAPVFTIVRAPDLLYRDDTRIAHYTGGVTLTRDKMTITGDELRAYLTPKTSDQDDNSSLDHAVAEGNVKVVDLRLPGRTRTGTSTHCEYWTKENKVVLNGGTAEVADSIKGVSKGQQLTYFSDDDRLVVDGKQKDLAFTKMRKK